jgi:SAM-dependent methyltransferase
MARSHTFTNMDTIFDADGNRYLLRPQDCPVCGKCARRLIGIRGGKFHRYKLGIESPIYRCIGCGLLFPDPFPEPQDVQKMYADPDKYFQSHASFDKKSEQFRGIIRGIRARVGSDGFSILDVGSGRGELLEAANLEGVARAVGLELSESMIEFAGTRGLHVVGKTAEDYAQSAPEPFDSVVLNAVVEHVDDPDSLIRSVVELVRPGGIIYIDIPNEPSLLSLLFRLRGWLTGSAAVMELAPTFPPYHVWGFNRRSMTALLNKYGCEVEEISVKAHFVAPHDGSLRDRARSLLAAGVLRAANATGTAHNMTAWVRRTEGPRANT